MLNISKESWHYKVTMQLREFHPESLCSYFWSFVFTLILYAIGCLCLGVVAVLLLGIFLDPILTFGLAWWAGVEPLVTFMFDKPVTWDAFVGSYVVYSILTVIGVLYWLVESKSGIAFLERLDERSREKKAALTGNEPLNASQVVWKGILAIKNKVCPLIKYVK